MSAGVIALGVLGVLAALGVLLAGRGGGGQADPPSEGTDPHPPSRPPPEDRHPPDDSPVSLADPPFAYGRVADQAEILLVESRVLHDRVGGAAARTAARQVHDALTAIDVPHVVRVPTASGAVDPPAEGTVGSGTPAWWRDHGADVLEGAAEEVRPPGDANVLLVDQVSGGGTYGQWAVAGGGGVDEDLPAADLRSDDAGDSLSAVLHELIHVFGVGHDLDDGTGGQQHTGVGWNADDGWHRTPACVDNGLRNACGERVPTRTEDAVVQELQYTACTAEHLAPLRHRE